MIILHSVQEGVIFHKPTIMLIFFRFEPGDAYEKIAYKERRVPGTATLYLDV